jgi:hypothetical protein
MRLLRALSAVAATFFICAQSAPPENPVMTHYRAYRTAMDAGDLATAENEADAALQASVARSGQGGNTGALALNLAQVRLTRGRVAEAYAPALQAFEIAQGGAAGVDPLLARLTLGRAELTDDRFRQGRERLMPALREATARPEVHADAYNAAADLGRKLMRENVYVSGAAAWAEALRFADLIPGDSTYVRAEARLGYGIAQFSHTARSLRAENQRGMDSNIDVDVEDDLGPARRALIEAANILRPLAYQSGNTPDLTPAQSLFSASVAWRLTLDSYMLSNGYRGEYNRLRGDEARAASDERISMATADDGPECGVNIIAEPRPNFPPQGNAFFSAGAVVVRFLVDESGQVTDTRVASAVPELWFAEAVGRVAPQWTIQRAADAPAGCRIPPILFQTTMFYFRS